MHLISPGGLHGKGLEVGGHALQIVFSMKRSVEILAIHYCMVELVSFKVLSQTNTVQSNLVRTNFKGLNKFVCLIGSSSYPDLTKNRYAYQMDCIYVKVHAVVHGKHVILSISQKQVHVHVSTMTKFKVQ